MSQGSRLTQYGMMAERHWRKFLPRKVKELEEQGKLEEALLEAEEKTKDEMDDLSTKLEKQGLTGEQAERQAWEMVRELYIFLTPEEEE